MALAALLLASTPALAERVVGRFTFHDYADNVARPINNVKVEIWRYKPGFLGIWGWSMDKRVWTDGNGWLDVTLPWAARGVAYELRVYAANGRVTVWPHDTAHVGESWYATTPQKKAWSSGDVLDFTQHFDWWTAARNFNIARAAWFAGEYLAQKYTSLPPAHAQTTEIYNSFYDPVGNTMQMNTNRDFDDYAIAHEYAHYVQEQIGSLPWEPSVHYMCGVSSPELAWMEGFADFYPYAVARTFPGELQGNHMGSGIESGTYCGTGGNGTERASTEYYVAATLFDLVDTNSWSSPSYPESHEWSADNDWLILSIVDHELGNFGSRPTIWDFRNAWYGRGMYGWELDSILSTHGVAY
jgi:hypothetical protein